MKLPFHTTLKRKYACSVRTSAHLPESILYIGEEAIQCCRGFVTDAEEPAEIRSEAIWRKLSHSTEMMLLHIQAEVCLDNSDSRLKCPNGLSVLGFNLIER